MMIKYTGTLDDFLSMLKGIDSGTVIKAELSTELNKKHLYVIGINKDCKRINAIRELREISKGLGLVKAKEIVEGFLDHGYTQPILLCEVEFEPRCNHITVKCEEV